MKIIDKLLITAFFLFCATSNLALAEGKIEEKKADRNCEQIGKDGKCDLYGVSLIELIANPEKYHNKRVRIIGYLRIEFEGNAIYLHREDWANSISKNGLWLDIDLEKTPLKTLIHNNEYALVEGVFNAQSFGHMGMWSGTIKDITRIDPWGMK